MFKVDKIYKTSYSFNGLVINAMNYALENMEEKK